MGEWDEEEEEEEEERDGEGYGCGVYWYVSLQSLIHVITKEFKRASLCHTISAGKGLGRTSFPSTVDFRGHATRRRPCYRTNNISIHSKLIRPFSSLL